MESVRLTRTLAVASVLAGFMQPAVAEGGPMMTIPDSVIHLIGSIRIQSDIVTAISGAGVVVVLMTVARVRGFMSDVKLTHFRKPGLLFIPWILFFVSFVLGYGSSSLITGYFAEITAQYNTSGAADITNAHAHFVDDYFSLLQRLGSVQLLCSVLALLALSVWFAVNIYFLDEKDRTP